jgi:hypothetical protein
MRYLRVEPVLPLKRYKKLDGSQVDGWLFQVSNSHETKLNLT